MKTNYFSKIAMVLYFCIVGTAFSYAQKKYEAENAVYGGGAEFRDEDQGYSGTGFVRNFNSVGQYVEFSITGATAGAQDVTLHYATAIAGSLNLYVNGTFIRSEEIPASGGWSTWVDYQVNVTLNAGNNTIKFIHEAANTGNFFYYIDYLTVIESPSSSQPYKSDDAMGGILLSQNPFSKGTLSIKLPESATQLSIFDITGKAVYQTQVTKNEYSIDQSAFRSEGVYVVNVMTAKGSKNQKLIVIK